MPRQVCGPVRVEAWPERAASLQTSVDARFGLDPHWFTFHASAPRAAHGQARSVLDLGAGGATIAYGPTMTSLLRTPRLDLVPMTLALVEAVIRGRREDAERIVDARMPARWPNRELIERAFTASLEAIAENPETRLWGDRVMIVRVTDGEPRVVGSVVFHGLPGDDGVAEIAYGVEDASQGMGYATEAVEASVGWALDHPRVHAVQAATFAWHRASLRVIEKIGMVPVGSRDHETMGELVVYEKRRTG